MANYIHYAINLRGGVYDELLDEENNEIKSYKEFPVEVTHELAKEQTLQMSVDYEIWFTFGEKMRNRTMTKKEFKAESQAYREHYRIMDEHCDGWDIEDEVDPNNFVGY